MSRYAIYERLGGMFEINWQNSLMEFEGRYKNQKRILIEENIQTTILSNKILPGKELIKLKINKKIFKKVTL